MWSAAGDDPRAVQLYLKVHSDAALDKAVAVVEKVHFTHTHTHTT